MRIRSIKPEFWRSEDIADLTVEDRLLFIGLWSYVDDNGVGIDRLADVCADLFALDLERDPPETFARVSRGLQNLSEAGRIVRYTVEGKSYLHISNWTKHQRIDKPNKARYPHPDAENATIREEVATPSRHPRETPAPGTGEQGNRGTGEQGTCDPADAGSLSDAASGTDATEATNPDAEALSHYLADRIRTNGNKVRTVGKRWHDAMDRLIRIDGYTPEQIRQVIDWSQGNEFWAPNILSAPKLREKFDTLKGQMLNERNRSQRPERMTAADRNLERGYQIAQRYTQTPQQPSLNDNPFEADIKEIRA